VPDVQSATHYVYVLRCADASLYAGYTTDLARRLAQHQAGKGAKYTRSRRPVELVASWAYPDRSAALRAERAFKKLERGRKLETLLAHGRKLHPVHD
jgi:putative endonuclease